MNIEVGNYSTVYNGTVFHFTDVCVVDYSSNDGEHIVSKVSVDEVWEELDNRHDYLTDFTLDLKLMLQEELTLSNECQNKINEYLNR